MALWSINQIGIAMGYGISYGLKFTIHSVLKEVRGQVQHTRARYNEV